MDSLGVRRTALVAECGTVLANELRPEFDVVTPAEASEAELENVELVVADSRFPEGLILLKALKRRFMGAPAIWVGQSWEQREIEAALAAGATDVAVLPAPGEIAARARMAVYVRQAEHHELLSLAYTDELTGLPNRRCLKGRLKAAIHTARTRCEAMSLLILDIDRFKTLNDRFGHHVGDRALVEVAKVLKATSRSADTIGRWGGEEFVSLISGDLSAAEIQAERIRSAVADFPFGAPDLNMRITVSIGATQLDRYDRPQDLLERADHLLYQAKRYGRDRTVAGLAPKIVA
ncbi:MAG: GGDEF domain-containing protein, partial [Cyanobacteria bacterium REEB65]|nr:GGDEF domain-containing protein [Cyanobacteria bacterium REEB65]